MRKPYILTLIVVLVFSFSSISFADYADDFDSYVAYQNVQHRTYWSRKNKLLEKIWRLMIGIDESVDPGNVSGPGSFDELISKIVEITVLFETADDNCSDWNNPIIVDGPNTYNANQLEKMSHLGYSAGICPVYDSYLGQWFNPPVDEFCFANYELALSIPAAHFSITSAACGRWYVLIKFNDNSEFEIYDYWTREVDSAGWVPYAEIDYTEDPLPVSNSSSFNVNLKSLKCYRLRDKDEPGKKDNLILKWTPINPAFYNDPDDPVFWPGLTQRLGVAWEDKNLGALPYSGIGHSIYKAFWVTMPVHLDHYFLPWNYVEHIKQNSSLKKKGFKVHFQIRTNDGARLRQISLTGKVSRTVGKYPKWK